MQKLGKMTGDEQANTVPLKGSYRIIMDIGFGETNKATLARLEDSLKALGEIANISVEKYLPPTKFFTGEAVELSADFNCTKSLYVDVYQNLIISDQLSSTNVSSAGECEVVIPKGIVAEVNKCSEADEVELLFTGSAIEFNDKVAYLGVIRVPSALVRKA